MPATERSQRLGPEVRFPVRQSKILIVEDDIVAQEIWERVFSATCPNALVRWARTEEGAEMQIRNRLKTGSGFDLIIVDIFLAGKKNGVDLWRRYGCGPSRFLFTSCIEPEQFTSMIGSSCEGVRPPTLLTKPLNLAHCAGALREALSSVEDWSEIGDLTGI